jgi:hypothetical protein
MGFIASAAWGEDDMWDVALRYAGEFSGFKLAAGIAYAQWTDGTSTTAGAGNAEKGCARVTGAPNIGADVKCEELGLSASIMHVPTGLFVTGSYGYKDDDRRVGLSIAGNRSRDEQYTVMAGIEQKFFPLGKTTIYGEYIDGSFGQNAVRATTTLGIDGQNIRSTDVTIWGLGLNQQIDAAAMDVYVMYRNHEFDVTATNGVKANLEDLQIVTMGARIQF